jgi:hypothetical protein
MLPQFWDWFVPRTFWLSALVPLGPTQPSVWWDTGQIHTEREADYSRHRIIIWRFYRPGTLGHKTRHSVLQKGCKGIGRNFNRGNSLESIKFWTRDYITVCWQPVTAVAQQGAPRCSIVLVQFSFKLKRTYITVTDSVGRPDSPSRQTEKTAQ